MRKSFSKLNGTIAMMKPNELREYSALKHLFLIFAAISCLFISTNGFSKQEELKDATKLVKIDSVQKEATTVLRIIADGAISDYDSFEMEDPARIIVDIWGVDTSILPYDVPISSPYVKSVRIGRHPDKVRVVFDLEDEKVAFQYDILKEDDAIVVAFKEVAEPKVDAKDKDVWAVVETEAIPDNLKEGDKPLVSTSTSPEQYIVGIGDMLNIRVINEPGLNTRATVAEDGSITFPSIGIVRVKGMTLLEIKEEITERLSEEYIKYPLVSVLLVKSATERVYFVYGEVEKPGKFYFEDGMTVVKAIAMAGGLKEDALHGRIKLRRAKQELKRGKTSITRAKAKQKIEFVEPEKVKIRRKKNGESEYEDIEINLKKKDTEIILGGAIEDGVTGDMLLQPDDILIVERDKTFFIHGEVEFSGEYILERDMRIVEAITLAGGIRPEGLHGKIKIRRIQEGEPGYRDIEIDLKGTVEGSEIEDMLLQADDMIIVERNKIFFAHGEVSNPGEYVLEKNMTVVEAIAIAGGIKDTALYGKLKVRRKQEGDVYKDIVETDLNNGVIKNSEVEGMFLKPDDVLVVERNKIYLVYGEVANAGEYILYDKMTVFRAITLAGGFTKWGSPRRVKVLRPREDGEYETIKVNIKAVIEGNAAADIYLQPDDIIIASAGIF